MQAFCLDLQARSLRYYADQVAITALVQKCLDAKGQGIIHWESGIDDRVAHIYGLTPNDLKIIQK